MEITLKFRGKEIVFGEWKETLSIDTFSLRRTPVPPIKDAYIEWMLWHHKGGLFLSRNFQGPNGLYSLNKIYDQMYPNIEFGILQKEQAKDHMDLFIEKYNSLKAFL